MKLDINGKTALVTGSSKGIGESIAQNLSVEGCNVMLNGRNSHSLQRAMKTMKSKTDYFVADVTKPDECKLLVEHTIEQFGKLDILVCNVGSGRTVQQGKETLNDWIEMFRVNLFSAINTIKAAEKYLKKSYGTIVCISSIAGIENTGGPVTYSAAKSALNTFVHNESKKLGKSNPYNAEFTVLVCVSMDNLKEFSNVKLSNVNMLDKINTEIINEIKTKNAIFTS